MGETVVKEYDEWHSSRAGFEDGIDVADSPWHILAQQHIRNLTGQQVLEIGCGRGGFSKYLLDLGANLVAADFSPAAVDCAKRLLRDYKDCDLRVADIQNIPFNDNHFDLVVSLETLEHVPDPNKGLAELVRVTKPGGRLIITTPNYFGSLGLYRRYRELSGKGYTEVGQPINNPLKVKDRVHRLKTLGCRVDVIDGCGHYSYWPGRDPVRVTWLDQPRFIMKWFAAHSITVATKQNSH